MAVVEDLDEGERYLFALMQDASGIDMAEFMWKDETTYDSLFRCYDFQYPWYRDTTQFQIDQSARCFSAATLVLTRRGQVPINEVEAGDEVLTHRGRWRRVLDVVSRGEQDTVAVRGRGHYGIRCTPDHRFWTASVRRGTMKRDGHRGRVIEDQGFRRASEFSLGHATEKRTVTWWSSPAEFPMAKVPQMEAAYHAGQQNWVDDTNGEGFLWLYGLYLAEGSVSSSYGKGGKINRVTFSVHVDESPEVCAQLDELGLRYSTEVTSHSEKCINVKLNSEPLAEWFMREGGRGAKSKQIASWAYGLEPWQRQAIIDGAAYGDGSTDGRRFQYSTISKALAVGLRLLVQAQGIAASLGHADARPSEIRGRKLNTSEQYRVEWSVGQERVRGSFQDGMFWSPVYALEDPDHEEVWDLEVEEDHSFIADGMTVHNSVGKSLGIQMRAFAFPFHSPGEEMLLTAPELIHLNPITEKVEDRLLDCRVSAEMLKARGASNGITHRPFEAKFVNGARLVGRIPQKDGKGVKGQHPKVLEQDESQDYPEAGWVELGETLKYGNKDAIWRAHGVSKGVRDRFYKQSQPGSGWKVHRITAMHRNDWTPQEREAKAELYGSRDHPDYRRNILGLHGDAQSALFVLARLMACHPGNTPIHALERGVQTIKPLRDVRVGDTVLNAKGAGTVIDVIPSRHRVLLGVEVAGEVVHCTPEHPFLTTVGWRHADQLNIGDHILTAEDMRELWQGADRDAAAVLLTELLSRQALGEDQDREGIPARTPVRDVRGGADIEGTEAILLAGVLGQGSSSSDKSVPGLRNGVRGVEPKDLLLAGLRGQAEASTQSQARNPLSALRHDDHRRQGLLQVLHARLLECVEDPDLPGADLPGVRGGLHGPEHETLLLALLLCESEWPDTQDQSPSGGEGLRTLRGDVLPPGQEDQVLLEEVRQHRDSGQEAVAGRRLRTLRSYVQAEQANPSMVLEGMLVRSETGRAGSQESRRPPEARGSRRVASITVRSLDGTRGTGVGLGAAEMALSSGGIGRGPGVVHSGPVSSPIEDYRGGGWVEPSPRGGQEQGCDPGRVAGFARVDRIEVLEPGHPDWDRLSGGEDHVVCYDLTVSGHPSYAVGESALLVHNCVDSTQSSPYNEHEYHSVRITEEKFNDSGLPIEALLELPGAHKAYGTVWVGMDIGLTNDPSEILVFGETSESHSGKNRNPENSVLKLLTRIHLQRISAPNQRKVVEEVFNHYRPQAIALDRTGLGLPIYQEIMEDGGAAFQNSIRAYNFSEKILVGYEKEEELDETMWWEDQEPEPIMANVLEYSSDMLRLLVDTGRIHLPYDVTLIREFQGQTYQITKSSTNPYGRKVFSKGEYHALDAARMAALGFFQEQIGNLAPRELEPVLDSFVMG